MTEDRRARKKRETGAALRLAALRLVDAHGLEHVTVEMIAQSADVSTRTFFNYFPTKEHALVGPGPDASAHIADFCAGRPADESAFSVLRALLLERAAHFSDHTEEMELRVRVLNANPSLYARFQAGFAELERIMRLEIATRSGLDADRDLYPRVLAASAALVIKCALDQSRAGDRRTLAAIAEEAFDLCATGLDVVPVARRTPARRRPSVTAKSA